MLEEMTRILHRHAHLMPASGSIQEMDAFAEAVTDALLEIWDIEARGPIQAHGTPEYR